MYPYPIFWDIDLYTVFLCLGIAGALITFRIFSERMKIYWRVQNLVVISASLSVVVGYFSAVLFQALYNIKTLGGFVINERTGATFYGGLIGGAACFLTVYFVLGRFYDKSGEYKARFFSVTDIGAASIAIAHSLGRIGCLMAGCCHGGATDSPLGIYMMSMGCKVIPTQLYEAIFLFGLFIFFVARLIGGRSCNLPLYMSIYGVWRFAIEFVRRDYRGNTIFDGLTPSQLIAVLMVIGAVALFFGQRAIMKRMSEREAPREVVDEQ